MLSLERKFFESITKKLRKPIIVTASYGHLSELFGPTEKRKIILRKKKTFYSTRNKNILSRFGEETVKLTCGRK